MSPLVLKEVTVFAVSFVLLVVWAIEMLAALCVVFGVYLSTI